MQNTQIRDASCESDEKLRKFQVDCSMREDVYLAVLEYDNQRKVCACTCCVLDHHACACKCCRI